MKVEDLMTTPALTCRPEDPLSEAARQMWEGDCGCVPVVDREGRVLGMITDRDVTMAAYTQGHPLSAIPVSAVMSPHPIVVTKQDLVETAAERMSRHAVRRIPVVEAGGRIAGLVSLADLACAALGADGRERRGKDPGVSAAQFGQTLAAICEPRPHGYAAAGHP